jgi:hypothetical protein
MRIHRRLTVVLSLWIVTGLACSLVGPAGVQPATPTPAQGTTVAGATSAAATPANSATGLPPGQATPEAPGEAVLPEPPAPMALPAGTPEEQAAALAEALRPGAQGGSSRLAAWLAVYEALGIPVITDDGLVVAGPADDTAGPGYWRVWFLSAAGASPGGLVLTDYVRLFVPDPVPGIAYDPGQAAAALLADLRAAAESDDAQVRLFGRLMAEIALRGPVPVDVLDLAVSADQVFIATDTAELLAWVVLRGLIGEVALDEAARGAARAPAGQSLKVLNSARVSVLRRPAQKEKCSEAAGSEDVTFWLNTILNKLGGGVQLPGMQEGTKGFVRIIQEHLGHTTSQIERVDRITKSVNVITSALTLWAQIQSLRLEGYMDPDPLERTKTSRDGKTADIHLLLYSDPEWLPEADNLYACLASFVLNAFGVTLATPPAGRIGGAEMKFEGGQGFGETVLFGDYKTLRTDTNLHGEVLLPMLGKAQRRDLPDSVLPYMTEFSIHVSAQPEAVTANTLFNIFFSGLTFGAAPGASDAATSAMTIAKTFHWSLGEHFFRLKDWAEFVLRVEYNADAELPDTGTRITRHGITEIPLTAEAGGNVTGQADLDVELNMTTVSDGIVCEGAGQDRFQVAVEGRTGDDGWLQLKTIWTGTIAAEGMITCAIEGGSLSQPFTSLPVSLASNSALFTGFELPVEDRASEAFHFSRPEEGNTLITVTLVRK